MSMQLRIGWIMASALALACGCGEPERADAPTEEAPATSSAEAEPEQQVPREPGPPDMSGAHACHLTLWASGPETFEGRGSGATADEAERQAEAAVCETLRKAALDCDEDAHRVGRSTQRSNGVFTAVLSYVRTRTIERSASSDESRVAACQRAFEEGCPEGARCGARVIDGLSRRSVDSTPAAGPGECELLVRLAVIRGSGAATAPTLAEAERLATEQACAAVGEGEVDCPSGYEVLTSRQETSASGASAEIGLGEIQNRRGAARSEDSRLEACRAALRAACAPDPCPTEHIYLETIDGIDVGRPRPERWLGGD